VYAVVGQGWSPAAHTHKVDPEGDGGADAHRSVPVQPPSGCSAAPQTLPATPQSPVASHGTTVFRTDSAHDAAGCGAVVIIADCAKEVPHASSVQAPAGSWLQELTHVLSLKVSTMGWPHPASNPHWHWQFAGEKTGTS
jgi:hypothetical protein